MPRLIATRPLHYASRDLKAGEAFEASESDARVLCAVGRATELREAVACGDLTPNEARRALDMQPVPAAAEAPSEHAYRPKRAYRRRDLVPEE